jgi:hypothetical protein
VSCVGLYYSLNIVPVLLQTIFKKISSRISGGGGSGGGGSYNSLKIVSQFYSYLFKLNQTKFCVFPVSSLFIYALLCSRRTHLVYLSGEALATYFFFSGCVKTNYTVLFLRSIPDN